MFYQSEGEVFRSVLAEEGGEWLVSYDDPAPPCFVSAGRIRSMERIAPPAGYLQGMDREATEGQKKRREIVRPLLEDQACITDRAARLKKCREIAEKEGCTVLRVQRLFYRSLAGRALVEKTFDLIQQKYKPLLRGKGVIEEDARERWAVDYRSQAALTLEDFTKVVIHCVIYLNSCRVLKNCPERLADAEPVPAGLWKWHEEQGESVMIPIDREQIRLLGLPRKTANLTRKGISLDGLWYADANSRKLLESGAGKVQIAYDPEDAGQIYVVTKNGYVKVDIAARCRRYAGTSREERRAEQEKQKVRRKELEQRDMQGRIDLARNIQAAAAGKGPQAPERLNGTIIRKNKEAEAI